MAPGLTRPQTSRPIRCAACGHAITSPAARIEVEGAHLHRRTNPVGVTFAFGCFDRAPGCAVPGEPEPAHTWFAGHPWRFAVCRGCAAHLGWFWEAPGGGGFFGLILANLDDRDAEA